MNDELYKMKREIRCLKAYALLGTVLLAATWIAASVQSAPKPRFAEIDVERINIVEKDGKLRMVIGNKERTPGPVERGIPFGYGSGRRVGLIFYNDEGTECGGLAFGSSRRGSAFEAGATLAFDQYDQDQAVVLQQYESDTRRYSGLAIAEYPTGITNKQRTEQYEKLGKMPDGPAKKEAMDKLAAFDGRTRAYFGRAQDGAAVLRLADPAGNTRLRLRVDALGAARIEFLDEKGRVVRSIPE
jgi:hypothetical protein